MRVFILLVLLAGVALATPNYELNNIRATVANAENRLAANQLPNARHFVDSAKASMAKAKPETKADPEFAQLQAKLAQVEKRLVALEAGAGKARGADEKMREAGDLETFARLDAEQDDHDKAKEKYARCVALVDEALKLDPTARTRTVAGNSLSNAEIEKACRAGAKKQFTQGPAAETEDGKAALAAYAVAMKAAATRKLKAQDLVAGIQGADECRNRVGRLGGFVLRNGKFKYDKATERFGKLTMEGLEKACAKLQTELKQRTATGCGRKYAGISQQRFLDGKLGPIKVTGGGAYEVIACSAMPKANKFPGLAASFKAKFQQACGKRAIYVIDHARWVDNPGSRSMAGTCFEKGELRFHK